MALGTRCRSTFFFLVALVAVGSLPSLSAAVPTSVPHDQESTPESGKEALTDSLQHVLGLLDRALDAEVDEEDHGHQPRSPRSSPRKGSLLTTSRRSSSSSSDSLSLVSPVQMILSKDVRALHAIAQPVFADSTTPPSDPAMVPLGDASRELLEGKAKDLAKVDAIWQLSVALRELGQWDAKLEAKEKKGRAFNREMKGLVERLEKLAAQASEDLRIARVENSALRERVKYLEAAAKGERLKSEDPVDEVFERQHQQDLAVEANLKEEVEGLKKYGAEMAKKAKKNQREANSAELLSKWLAKERSGNKPLREEANRLLADKAALVLQVKDLTAQSAEKAAEKEARSDGISLQAEFDDRLRACELDRDVGKRNYEERIRQLEKEAFLRDNGPGKGE